MKESRTVCLVLLLAAMFSPVATLVSQPPGNRQRPRMPRFKMTKLVKQFDQNHNGRLEEAERVPARAHLAALRKTGSNASAPPAKGRDGLAPRQIAKDSVQRYPDRGLFDLEVIRTIFVDFDVAKWETELQIFYRTDVEVPATLTVDGQSYRDVGVHYRGSSSYFNLHGARKTSFAISMNYVHGKQRLRQQKTLNLLNGHADPSFMRTVLFAHIAGHYVPIPKACYVHLVVNGESWGLYILDQQLNKDFLAKAFGDRKGARWKIPPNFNGEAALFYQGAERKDYDGKYLLKSAKSKKKAWARLIEFCKLLHDTPNDQLESVLPEILDVDRACWFLAVDNVLMDGDGYHYRGSDYALYLDSAGRFCPLFRDNNEAFNYGGGPGGFGRPAGAPATGGRRRSPRLKSASLDPLALIDQERAPLVSKLLAVPKWRAQYLANCREILDSWVDWRKVEPLVERLRGLIEPLIKLDDKGLYGHDAFVKALDHGTERSPGLQRFFTERREFLLAHPTMKQVP